MNDHLFFKANLDDSSGIFKGLLICLSSEALRNSLYPFSFIEPVLAFCWLSARQAFG